MKYTIEGNPFSYVTCHLEAGEYLISESGSMGWMSGNMEMDTISFGGIGKVFERLFTGESLLFNKYTAKDKEGSITFASKVPGSISVLEIQPNKSYIVQKTSFLACEAGVDLGVHFHKRFSKGFFGGEGFILEKLSGQGKAFIEIDGSAKEIMLQAGEKLIVDTGCLVAMEDTCHFDIEMIKGFKNIAFGGEGLFNTVLTGPGKVILQSCPLSRTAAEIQKHLPPQG